MIEFTKLPGSENASLGYNNNNNNNNPQNSGPDVETFLANLFLDESNATTATTVNRNLLVTRRSPSDQPEATSSSLMKLDESKKLALKQDMLSGENVQSICGNSKNFWLELIIIAMVCFCCVLLICCYGIIYKRVSNRRMSDAAMTTARNSTRKLIYTTVIFLGAFIIWYVVFVNETEIIIQKKQKKQSYLLKYILT